MPQRLHRLIDKTVNCEPVTVNGYFLYNVFRKPFKGIDAIKHLN